MVYIQGYGYEYLVVHRVGIYHQLKVIEQQLLGSGYPKNML
jgi:hypothetical protein